MNLTVLISKAKEEKAEDVCKLETAGHILIPLNVCDYLTIN